MLQPGHPYDSVFLDDHGRVVRDHGRKVATISTTGYAREDVGISFGCEETASPSGGNVRVTAPTIGLFADAGIVTADQARQIAAALLEAADQLDALR